MKGLTKGAKRKEDTLEVYFWRPVRLGGLIAKNVFLLTCNLYYIAR